MLMKKMIEEVSQVGGVAYLLWHPHTLTGAYGWRDGYLDLIDILMEHE